MSTQDFTPKDVFSQGLLVAVETDQRGEAPSGNNLFWFQGGTWVQVVTQDLPSLYDRQELIFPAGHAGKRSMNTQPPVQGRRWGDGGFTTVVTSEFLGHLLYGALGAASHNTVPGATVGSALMASSGVEADTQQFALEHQPSGGGARLQINLLGTGGSGGLRIAGNDPDGTATSETITFDQFPTSLYTRTSFSSVTGIDMLSFETASAAGSISVNGISYWEHTFTAATTNPTFSIERLGDPAAGATSKSFMHVGMVVTDLTMNNPAEARDGVITVEGNWEGDPSVTCNAKGVQEASSIRIWPAWILALTRDNSVYNRVTNATFSIPAGNRNYRSAAGVQTPQGSFYGAREMTGAMDVLLADETEFNRWRGASKQAFRMVWDSPWKLTSTINEKLEASMLNTYLENTDTTDNDGMYMYSSDFRMVVDSANDIVAFKLTNGIPADAYGGSTVMGA